MKLAMKAECFGWKAVSCVLITRRVFLFWLLSRPVLGLGGGSWAVVGGTRVVRGSLLWHGGEGLDVFIVWIEIYFTWY
jgi:hypothetical protein